MALLRRSCLQAALAGAGSPSGYITSHQGQSRAHAPGSEGRHSFLTSLKHWSSSSDMQCRSQWPNSSFLIPQVIVWGFLHLGDLQRSTLLEYLHTASHSGHTNLHPPQQGKKVVPSPHLLFGAFLRDLHLCLRRLSVFACCLLCPLGASISVIAVLKSRPSNCSIPAISEFGFDACSVPSNC